MTSHVAGDERKLEHLGIADGSINLYSHKSLVFSMGGGNRTLSSNSTTLEDPQTRTLNKLTG